MQTVILTKLLKLVKLVLYIAGVGGRTPEDAGKCIQ